MQRLSSSPTDILSQYDVVVVGSGYGASIAASRLARAGKSVCVLERGREFLPGDFPDTVPRALEEMQASLPHGRVGSDTALFDFHVDDDINVLRGCGLGGTSLINANVSIRPDPRVFQDPVWPAGLRTDVDTRLAQGFRRANNMLKPVPYPATLPPLAKLSTLERSAERLKQPFRRVDINVTFEDLSAGNHVGVPQHACTSCGDCVSGCNAGAKNTTAMNYLPDAHNHGARIFCGVLVRRVEKTTDGLVVHYVLPGSGRDRFDGPEQFVKAQVVVLGAGALGSTEILLRSARHGLSISEQVGHRFGGNGDVLGFSYNTEDPVNGIGLGHRRPSDHEPVGPCITGVIDARGGDRPLDEGMIIEEGVVPGALAPILPEALAVAATSHALGAALDPGKSTRIAESLIAGAYRGAAHHTQTYLAMGHDGADGQLYLEGDRLRVRWPGVGDKPIFSAINQTLENCAAANGGTYVKNPTWSTLLKHALVTVHPLGGCSMGEDAETGVVNHKGQVFRGPSGADVYDGLYVADGAVVPRSLGANPLFTISALAERICELLAEDRGWTIDEKPHKRKPRNGAAMATGVQFTETMKGYFFQDATVDYQAGYEQGQKVDSSFRFVLTIRAQDADALIRDPNHLADMTGTVEAPALSPHPLTVSQGKFNLFIHSTDQVDTKKMIYRMVLTDVAGKSYFFHGFKLVHDDHEHDLWPDTTTLSITLYEGGTDEGPVVGKGILRLDAADFAKQLTTMKALNAPDRATGLHALGRFGEAFAGDLIETYGGVLAPNPVLAPGAQPRARRPLRAPVPETHAITTGDKVRLKLTRYEGGRKGPVVLAPGFGNRAAVYALDTVETSFVEYLVKHGYDVWLFDRRSSPALSAARTPYTIDHEAKYDWPAAIDAVRKLTGAADVQVVAHCMGAMTLLMATIEGLKAVRSAVCSQVTTYFHTDALNRLKAQIGLANGLAAIGIRNVNALFRPNLGDAAIETVLQLFPASQAERCRDPVCHRIFGIFGPVYTHSQLDSATHRAMSEIFGVANVTVLKHLLKILRAGKAVDAKGKDAYLPHVARLSGYPIHFIAGTKNEICKPSASEQLYQELAKPGSDQFTRTVFDGYAHLDCFVGKNAAKDIFPDLVHQLDRHNAKQGT
jgi:cholesterol oxidase